MWGLPSNANLRFRFVITYFKFYYPKYTHTKSRVLSNYGLIWITPLFLHRLLLWWCRFLWGRRLWPWPILLFQKLIQFLASLPIKKDGNCHQNSEVQDEIIQDMDIRQLTSLDQKNHTCKEVWLGSSGILLQSSLISLLFRESRMLVMLIIPSQQKPRLKNMSILTILISQLCQ